MNFVYISRVIYFSILIVKLTYASECCKDSYIKDATKCRNNNSIAIKCDDYSLILNPEWGLYSQFLIGKDADGNYLDAYMTGYLVREPNYCNGSMQYTFSNRTVSVAVVCSSSRVWYNDQTLKKSEDFAQEIQIHKVYVILQDFLNILSTIALLLTAAIYLFLPEVKDLQGTCYFFMTFIAGLGHLSVIYLNFFDGNGILPNMCITNMYLTAYFALSGFVWSSIVCYNTRRYTKNIQSGDEEKLLKTYKIIGFGVPLGIMFIVWFHVHLNHASEFNFVLECLPHQSMAYPYIITGILSCILFNFIMFIDSQIKIWNQHTTEGQNNKMKLKIIKYRLFMNTKLFFVMGIPWFLYVLLEIVLTSFVSGSWPLFLDELLLLLINGEGIPIFIIMVILRKRVLRGMGNRWFKYSAIYPNKWKTSKDSETEEESDVEDKEGTPSNIKVQYTPNGNTAPIQESASIIL